MLVQHFLEDSAARLGNKVALVWGGQRLTYRQIDQASSRVAARLVALGVRHQDRIVLFLDNSSDAVISLFGVLKAGGVFVLLNPTMKAPKLRYILRDSGARAMITHPSKARVVTEATVNSPDLEHIVWCQGSGGTQVPEGASLPGHIRSSTPWNPATLNIDPAGDSSLPRIIDVDLATIIYTSGSTGEPKGVVSAHYNVVAAARSITTYLKKAEHDIVLNALPLSFDYGLYQVLLTFLVGGTLVLEKSFLYPNKILERIVAEGVTGFPVVPTMVAILLQMGSLSRFDLSRLRYLTNTGAALPGSYIEALQSRLPHVEIFSMYGLTECKRVSYLPPEHLKSKPLSVGIPMPNEEVFIVDERGRELGAHQVGELVVRGSNVMQGYWNCPEETARTFRPGRYRGEAMLYTGDLFKKDEDGFLYFVARKDDLIKTKGERVSPKELENSLCDMAGIIESAVIGVPDDILGKAIKAFIVCDKKKGLTREQVLSYCHKNLEPFMVPKYLDFLDVMPKTGSGKIDKEALAASDSSGWGE